jgi:DNA-binding CsgD family transcriptional regulator
MDIMESDDRGAELVCFAGVMASICALPGAATADWCDRAACSLAGLFPGAMSLVLIGVAEASGEIASREAIGAYAGASEGRTSLDALRSRAFHLSSVPVTTPLVLHGCTSCHVVSDRDAAWTDLPASRVWSVLGAQQVFITSAKLGNDPGRVMHAQIALRAARARVRETALMAAIAASWLAPLAERSIGGSASEARHWLSTREQQVLEQLIAGRSIKQIAQALSRSPHTVHDHVKSLHRKLGARTRGELIARALGFLPSGTNDSEGRNPMQACGGTPARSGVWGRAR